MRRPRASRTRGTDGRRTAGRPRPWNDPGSQPRPSISRLPVPGRPGTPPRYGLKFYDGSNPSRGKTMAQKKCPVCGVSVKLENLERHLRNQHPRADVDLETAFTEEERREATQAKTAALPTITAKGKQWIAIVSVAVAAVLILVIWNPFGGVGPGVGQLAPDFTVETSTTGTVTLSAYRGSPVVLEFMDVDCDACKFEAR